MEISAIAMTAHKIILHIRFSSFHCAFSLFYYKMHFIDNTMLLFIFIIYIYEMMLCRSINSKFSAMFTPLLENIQQKYLLQFFSRAPASAQFCLFRPKRLQCGHPISTQIWLPTKISRLCRKKRSSDTLLLFPYYYLLCFNCLRGLPALFHLQAFPALFRLQVPVRLLLYPSPCWAWVLRWEMSRWAQAQCWGRCWAQHWG